MVTIDFIIFWKFLKGSDYIFFFIIYILAQCLIYI